MRQNTEKKVFDYIKKYNLIKEGDKVVAGVSGGADSMCMLLLLLELKKSMDISITVAHVDHGIRGAEAKADAGFVKSFCESHSIGFELAETDIPAIVGETGLSPEEAGRNYRYEFFCRTAEKYGASKIAVAHTKGDHAETVLFNIIRGSGIKGLKGISPMRAVKTENGGELMLIRPILSLSRDEIEEYLEENGQSYRTDSTNMEDTYSRNRLRNRIIPEIKEYINSNVTGHIESLSAQASEAFDFIERETDRYNGAVTYTEDADGKVVSCRIDYSVIGSLHPVLKKNILRRAFEKAAGKLKDVEETHIIAIDDLYGKQSGKKLSMPYGITAKREYDSIVLQKETGQDTEDDFSDTVTMYVVPRSELSEEIPKVKDEKWFDAGLMAGKPEVRTRKDGDYLLIGKEKHKKSLNRFLIDNKIPPEERDRIPVLAVGSHVLWVIGYRQDESCLITPGTENVLVVKKKG